MGMGMGLGWDEEWGWDGAGWDQRWDGTGMEASSSPWKLPAPTVTPGGRKLGGAGRDPRTGLEPPRVTPRTPPWPEARPASRGGPGHSLSAPGMAEPPALCTGRNIQLGEFQILPGPTPRDTWGHPKVGPQGANPTAVPKWGRSLIPTHPDKPALDRASSAAEGWMRDGRTDRQTGWTDRQDGQRRHEDSHSSSVSKEKSSTNSLTWAEPAAAAKPGFSCRSYSEY